MESLRAVAPSDNTGCTFSIAAGETGPPVSAASLDETCAMGVVSYPGAAVDRGSTIRGGPTDRAIRPPVGIMSARLGFAAGGQRERGRYCRADSTTITGIDH
jgi:hypothetical protein